MRGPRPAGAARATRATARASDGARRAAPAPPTAAARPPRLRVSLSSDARAVDLDELLELLVRCTPPGGAPGQALGEAGASARPAFRRRLARALAGSVAVAAAFAAERDLPPLPPCASEPATPPEAPGGLAALAPPRRRLVGFARAAGDGALVATLHDVAVLPEARRRGVGTRLVARLARQLAARGMTDIGALVPTAAAEAFFEAAAFGDDTEESTVMALRPAAARALLLGDEVMDVSVAAAAAAAAAGEPPR
jgi:GNAT superfamily N-acetyltransferase